MKKIIIVVVFVVCLFFASFTGYYIGTKSAHTTVIEEVIEETTETDVDELRNSIKAEVYADAYNEGYEKGKTEVFQLMLEEEEQEDYNKRVQELEEEIEELNNKPVETSANTQPNYEETQDVNLPVEETSSSRSGFNFLDCICYTCNLQFNSRYELNEHCIFVHGVDCGYSDSNYIDVPGYKCSICNKIFYDIDEYQQHISNHTDYSSNDW